jgi:hypothetical protein
VVLRGVGHVPMFDDPEQVARVLLKGSEPVAPVATLAGALPAGKVAPPTRRRVAVASA